MPGAYKLIPPVDQDYPDHMKLIAVKNDPGFSLGFGVVVNVNKAQDQVAKVVVGLLAVLFPHLVEAIYQNRKIVTIKLDFHRKTPFELQTSRMVVVITQLIILR